MPILYAFLGILTLIFLITYVKLDTFISFILVAIALGIITGMPIPAIGKSIQAGIGNTLGDLILIIGFGAMLGKLVADSGAAQKITEYIISIFGVKNVQWGLALAGFIIGIPLFYNAGFIIVVPLIFAVASSTRLPILYIAIPMCSALSVAHGYLPPHPSPVAISTQIGADMSIVLIYGIIVAIPAIIVAGPLFGRTLRKYEYREGSSPFQVQVLPKEQLPSLSISILTTLLPLLLFCLTALIKSLDVQSPLLQLLGEPYIGMLLSVLLAIYLLGIRQGGTMKVVMKKLEEAFKSTASILLIVAGAGALKQILNDSNISKFIGEQLQYIPISPLVLSWGIAGAIRVAVGSATVAGLTVVGILAPMIQQQTDIKPELMVLAIGAGSLMFSHLNDAGFWLFKEYFNLTIKETLLTWTVMETLVSVIGLLGVLILNMVV
ncbi:MAG: GntP family permease [Thermoflexibacter sp.]|jgi:Gnt-I system high-affinity gluconate transporter|nr:GntP family permease [Thermoflexibacter sp.]